MREVGIREFRASLSEILRLAGNGERIRVTVRGRAVADIVTPEAGSGDDRLRSLARDGRLVPPARPKPHRAPRLVRTARSASRLVLDDRDAGR